MTIAELLESVRRVEVRTNRLVNDMMVGAYLSHFKGRGMDFEELREYIPGDEVRDIDWNVTYRMGRPFVKRYREERELAMVLSASADFGSVRRSKREFATEIAGTLAISATRSSDKVALLLFTDQIELYLPPRKGRRHILRVLREALHLPAKHRGTNVSAALAFLNRVLPRRSIIFLLTDFLHSFGPGENSPKDSRIETLNVPQKKTPHSCPLPLGRGEGESSPVHLRREVHGEGERYGGHRRSLSPSPSLHAMERGNQALNFCGLRKTFYPISSLVFGCESSQRVWKSRYVRRYNSS